MSAADLVAVVVVIVAVAAATTCCIGSWLLVRTSRALRAEAEGLAAEAAEVLADLRAVTVGARSDLARADALIDRAEGISAALEDASKLTYLAVSTPIIKVASVASGVRRGAGRLRRGSPPPPPPPPRRGLRALGRHRHREGGRQ